MNIDETMDFINSFSKSGKAITDLSRARGLMERVGNPEKQLKFIHVAGTNGKGSTVEYISNALILSGFRTGQFTSPFITHYADRIRINGREIDEESLCEIAETVKNAADSRDYSQFEITMAIAMLWYVREKCDIVVLEVGIGGLLDCTNVIPSPVASVITSISLDHTAILGDTVEKIAVQKAGIVKENSAVVLSMYNKKSVGEIVGKAASEKGSLLIQPDADAFEILGISAEGSRFRYCGREYTAAMIGRWQCVNAVTAIEVCRYIRSCGFDVSEDNIAMSIETSRVKARVQFIGGNPPVIVDGGHNPDGVENVISFVRGMKCIAAVMGMVDSKDYESSVRRVAQYCDIIYTVDGFAYNCISAEKLAETAGRYTLSDACTTLGEAVGKAKKYACENSGTVLVCGSLYLASEYLNNTEL